MTFDLNKLTRAAPLANNQALFTYVSPDGLDAIEAAGYFNGAAKQLSDGDVIFISGAEVTIPYTVTSNDGSTVAVSSGVPSRAGLAAGTEVVGLAANALIAGSAERTVANKLAERLSVKDFSAVADAKQATGGGISAASATLVIGTSTFASTDVGKYIYVPGAGAAGANLWTTIAGYTSATTVTLTDAASTTVSGKVVIWGTDNTAFFQAAIDKAVSLSTTTGLRFPIKVPRGAYLIGSALTMYQGVELSGDGIGDEYTYCPTIFSPNSSTLDYTGTCYGMKLRGLTFVGGDGSAQSNDFFSTDAIAADFAWGLIEHCGFVGYRKWTLRSTGTHVVRNFFNKAPGVTSGRGVFIRLIGSDNTYERNFADGAYIPYSDDAGATYNYLVQMESRKSRFTNNYLTGSTYLANYGATCLYLKGASNNEGMVVAHNVVEFCQGAGIYAENLCSSQLIGNTITAVLKSAFDYHIAQVIYSNCHDIVQSNTLWRSVLPVSTRAQARFITGCTNIVVTNSIFDSAVTTINYQQRDTSTGCLAFEPGKPSYMRFALTANKTIDGADSGRTFYNTHASSQWVGTLPTSIVGLSYDFVSAGAAGIKATPASGDTIEGGTVNQSAAVTGAGNRFRLVCYVAGTWSTESVKGTISYS